MKTPSIDQKFIDEEIMPLIGIKKDDKLQIAERVDFSPGEQIINGEPGLAALYKLGSGTKGRQYVVMKRSHSKADINSALQKVLPFATYTHFVNLLERRKSRDEKHENDLGDTIGIYEDKLTDFKKKLYETEPAHNSGELRELTGSPEFQLYALKWLGKDKIEGNPEIESGFRREHALISRITEHQNVPKANSDLIETEKGLGYLVTYRDCRTMERIISDDWWKKVKDTEKVLRPEIVIAAMNQFYDGINHLCSNDNNRVMLLDINLPNTVIGFDGNLSLIDFGFCVENTKGKEILEHFGGSQEFYPPEFIERIEEISIPGGKTKKQTMQGAQLPLDIRSLSWMGGILTYKIASGGLAPFIANSFTDLRDSITKDPIIDLRRYNASFKEKEIEALVGNALQKDRTKRKTPLEMYEITYDLLKKRKISKTPQEVLREFMQPLQKIRSDAYQGKVVPQAPPKQKTRESEEVTVR